MPGKSSKNSDLFKNEVDSIELGVEDYETSDKPRKSRLCEITPLLLKERIR